MTDVPPSLAMNDEDEAALDDEDEDNNPDKRMTQRRFDKRVEKNGELSDSEDEDMAQANGVRRQNGTRKRRQIIDHRNLRDNLDSAADSGIGTPAGESPMPDAEFMNLDTPNKRSADDDPIGGSPEGDVTMGDADEPSAADSTKAEAADNGGTNTTAAPISADEAIKIKEEMQADEAAAAAQEEGRQEREELNAEGEARTEAAKTDS